jgi:hypothetical protein
MLRRGKPEIPVASDERLYVRFNDGELDSSGPTNAMFKAPDQSLNRSNAGGKYWFTLMPEPDEKDLPKKLRMGVVSFAADVIPSEILTEDKSLAYNFRVEHDPMEHNYYHCEVRIYIAGQRLTEEQADALTGSGKSKLKQVKKKYRDHLRKQFEAKKMVVVMDCCKLDAAVLPIHCIAPLCAMNPLSYLRTGGTP